MEGLDLWQKMPEWDGVRNKDIAKQTCCFLSNLEQSTPCQTSIGQAHKFESWHVIQSEFVGYVAAAASYPSLFLSRSKWHICDYQMSWPQTRNTQSQSPPTMAVQRRRWIHSLVRPHVEPKTPPQNLRVTTLPLDSVDWFTDSSKDQESLKYCGVEKAEEGSGTLTGQTLGSAASTQWIPSPGYKYLLVVPGGC